MNFWPFKKKPVCQNMTRPLSTPLTVLQWRQTPQLVTLAQKLFADPNFQLIIAVLRNDAPHNYGMPTRGAQATDFVHRVGDIEGYLKCLNSLEAMAVPLENNDLPEATFEPPETPK